jgi:hypothetical protein
MNSSERPRRPQLRVNAPAPVDILIIRVSGVPSSAHFIRASWSKHGPRNGKNWSKCQLAQIAMNVLHPDGRPPNVSEIQLTKDVNDWLLANYPHFAIKYGEIDRLTVRRAMRFCWDKVCVI